MVDLQTEAKTYGAPTANAEQASSSQNPPPPNDLHIKREVVDLGIFPRKGALHHKTHNTFASATHNYSIVGDLAQAPSAMSTLEVLQTCPTQRKALLWEIGGVDP